MVLDLANKTKAKIKGNRDNDKVKMNKNIMLPIMLFCLSSFCFSEEDMHKNISGTCFPYSSDVWQAKLYKNEIFLVDSSRKKIIKLSNSFSDVIVESKNQIDDFQLFEDTLMYLSSNYTGICASMVSVNSKKEIKKQDHDLKEFSKLRTFPYIINNKLLAYENKMEETLVLINMFSDSIIDKIVFKDMYLRTRCFGCNLNDIVTLVSFKNEKNTASTWGIVDFSKDSITVRRIEKILKQVINLSSILTITCNNVFVSVNQNGKTILYYFNWKKDDKVSKLFETIGDGRLCFVDENIVLYKYRDCFYCYYFDLK
jgi:hypothetical protein